MAMTTETTPISPAATAEAYVSFWNLSADDQRVLGATLFASDVARSTPIGESAGLDLDRSGRIAAITAFIDRAPDGFDPEAHHEEA
jgi:hypothetical protein